MGQKLPYALSEANRKQQMMVLAGIQVRLGSKLEAPTFHDLTARLLHLRVGSSKFLSMMVSLRLMTGLAKPGEEPFDPFGIL